MKKLIDEQKLIQHDLKELGKYSSMLSKTVHDINNPLAVFIGQISILEMLIERDMLTPEKLAKVIDKFKSSSQKFRDRLDDLRAFYKVPLNDPDFNKLGNILESTIYFYENQLYKHEIEYEVKIDKHAEFGIPGPHLFLCFKHILQNAIEAIKDTDQARIKVTASKKNELLSIKIKDNGPGLVVGYEEACDFGYSTKGADSQGFGLSIVKALSIENNFEVFYEFNGGAEFTINILDK
jgi:signal transduction histidine kinase